MSSRIETEGRYVVGTDGSERANKAVEWAAERAAARRLPLVVLSVLPEPEVSALESLSSHAVQQLHVDREAAIRRTQSIAEGLRGKYPGLDVTPATVAGNPAEVLSEASRNAEQVVVGARGETAPLSVKLLGGVSDAVAQHAHGRVSIIGDQAHENPGGPVVVGVDDSAAAREAARIGFDAAQVRGVPLIIVNAANGATDGSVPDSDPIRAVIAPAAEAYPDVEYEIRRVAGRPRDALVELSKQAGLVVVGSRGRGGFAGLLLGSTSKHVLREVRAPVIVTRG